MGMPEKRCRRLKQGAVCTADALWLGVIFSQSLHSAVESSQYSGRLTRLLQWLLQTDEPVDALEHLVRKLAHFAEFFLLGALAAATLAVFGLLAKGSIFHAIAPAVLAGLLVGLCDETLQLTSAGRAAQVSDVWLDWAGYLCGLAFCLFCAKTVVNSVKKRYDNKKSDSK